MRVGSFTTNGPGARYYLDGFLSHATPTDPYKTLVDFYLTDRRGQQLPFDARLLAEQVCTASRLGFDRISVTGHMGLPTGATPDDVDLVPRHDFDTPMGEALVQVGIFATLPDALGHPSTL